MQTSFYSLLLLYPLSLILNQSLAKIPSLSSAKRVSIFSILFLCVFYFLYSGFVFSSTDRSYFAVCSVAFSLFFFRTETSFKSLFQAFTLFWFSLFNVWNFTGVTDIVLLLGVFCFFDTDKKGEHSLFYIVSWVAIATLYFFVKEFQDLSLGPVFFEILIILSTLFLMPREKKNTNLSILQYIFCLSVLSKIIGLGLELSEYFYILFLAFQLIFSLIKRDNKYQSIQLMSICIFSAIIFLPVFGMDSFYQLFLIVYLLVFSQDVKETGITRDILKIIHVFYLFLIGYTVYANANFLTNLQILSAVLLLVALASRQRIYSEK